MTSFVARVKIMFILNPAFAEFIRAAVEDENRARKLLTYDPSLLSLRTGRGETALHHLAIMNYADAVQLLIELGAEVNVSNQGGVHVLYEAIRAEAFETVIILRRAGAVN